MMLIYTDNYMLDKYKSIDYINEDFIKKKENSLKKIMKL